MKLVRIIVASIIAIVAVSAIGFDASGARDRAPSVIAPTTAHGVNFLIKSQLDSTFCITVQDGTTEGRTISLQQCGGADQQRWVFSLNADDTSSILDNEGMCLDGRFHRGVFQLPVAKCQGGSAWRFAITEAGLIQNERNGKCLSIPAASSGASIWLVDCDQTDLHQLWALAH